jgi:hypothetical protein
MLTLLHNIMRLLLIEIIKIFQSRAKDFCLFFDRFPNINFLIKIIGISLSRIVLHRWHLGHCTTTHVYMISNCFHHKCPFDEITRMCVQVQAGIAEDNSSQQLKAEWE